MKKFVFTVTNDLNFDQRMMRICGTLAAAGHHVTLIGRSFRSSPALTAQPFHQKRLRCFRRTGLLAYAEFNVRLTLHLLFRKHDLVCAVDLDTILPCLIVSKLRGTIRVYDAHELFCEMKEVASRPRIHRFWKRVERISVPRFPNGYTVNEPIAAEFYRMYGVRYSVIRNMPKRESGVSRPDPDRYLLYQGAVNEGRSFETLIPAMKDIRLRLVICGDGNFMAQTQELVRLHGVESKVEFRGRLLPHELRQVTAAAWLGVTLFDDKGLSNYYSLANRFFDYMNAGVPQLCVDFPVYRSIVRDHPFALLLPSAGAGDIAAAVNNLLEDEALYQSLKAQCLTARSLLNWETERARLIDFYEKLFAGG